MIIIVEGSNKVGKSELIKKLSKMYNTKSIYNRDIRNQMKDAEQEGYISALAMVDVLKSIENQNIILDRFHLSEYVYGKLYRGYESIKMFDLESELNNMDVMLILVVSDYKHLKGKYMADKMAALKIIQNEFIKAYHKSTIKNKFIMKLEEI